MMTHLLPWHRRVTTLPSSPRGQIHLGSMLQDHLSSRPVSGCRGTALGQGSDVQHLHRGAGKNDLMLAAQPWSCT